MIPGVDTLVMVFLQEARKRLVTMLRRTGILMTIVPCFFIMCVSSRAEPPRVENKEPAHFVAPDWMVHDRPELAKALHGATVYTDIEYVPGASKIPLTNPAAVDPQALEYIKAGGKTRAFDLYFPEIISEKMPIVVFFHGGPNRGKKEDIRTPLVLLTQGYIVASANYRLNGEAPFPATVYDGKAVIRWLRAHAAEYHIDPDHIGVWGHSAGAMLVNWLGTANDEPSLEGDEGNLNFSSHVQAACSWSGGCGPLIHNSPTPLTYADVHKSAPFLIMHGTEDQARPFKLGQNLAMGLINVGVECTFIPVPGAGHVIGGAKLEKQVIDFFNRHLKSHPDTEIIEKRDLAK